MTSTSLKVIIRIFEISVTVSEISTFERYYDFKCLTLKMYVKVTSTIFAMVQFDL